MGHIFLSVANFPRLLHFTKCAAFFQFTHTFSKYGTFLQVWQIFLSLVHFSKCGAFLQVLCNFLSVAYSSKCDAFYERLIISPSVVHFINSCAFLFWTLGAFLSTVAYLSKFGAYCHKSVTFLRLPRFTNCAAFFQVLACFPSVPHFWNCAAFFSKCGAFFRVRRSRLLYHS